MLQDLLIPEELLQLDKLESSIELCEDTSFLALLGADTNELANELEFYVLNQFEFITTFTPHNEQILKSLSENEQSEDFVIVNLFEKDAKEYIKNLLFFRDYISDNTLKIILIFNKDNYQSILKEAIDLYNIATFAYFYNTYKVLTIEESIDKADIENLINEYKKKKKELSKLEKISFLFQIGLKYSECEEIDLGLKYFNEALIISTKLKHNQFIFAVKAELGKLYRYNRNFKISEKYLFESLVYNKDKDLKQSKYLLEQISLLYYDKKDMKSAIKYCKELENLCLGTKDEEYLSYTYNIYISIYNFYKDYKKMDEYFELAFKMANKNNDKLILADLFQSKSVKLLRLNKYKESVEYLNKALSLYQKEKKIYMIFLVYKALAVVFNNLGDKKKALVYARHCYSFFKKNNFLSDLVFVMDILNQNENKDKLEKLEVLLESLKISKQANNIGLTLTSIVNLSEYYRIFDKDYNGKKYIDEIINILPKVKEDEYKYNGYIEIINIYFYNNQLEKCYEFYNKLINLNIKISENELLYLDELYGEILIKDKKLAEAEEYFKKAYKKAIKNNSLRRMISLEKNLGYLYKEKEQRSLAKKYFMEALLKIKTINNKSKDIEDLEKEIKSL